MNADDTAKAPGNGAFQPISDNARPASIPPQGAGQPASGQQPVSGQPASGQQPVRRTGVLPTQAGAQAATGQQPATMPQSIPPATGGSAPVSGSVPQRSAFRPTTTPSSAPPSVQPASGQQPSRTASTGTFSPAPVPASATAAATGAGVATTAAPTTAPGAPTTGADAAGGLSIGDRFKGLTTRAKDGAKTQLEKADREVAVTAGSGPRKARVLVSRIDPWSSLKIGFLLSIAAGIMLVVMMHVLWSALNGMGVFDMIQEWVSKLFTADQELNILQFFEYSKVMSATLLIAVVNVVLLTGLAVVATFLYNIISRVVGGVYMTLTDD